eukprot:1145182-Alexandrium_andersonii.AAC.1
MAKLSASKVGSLLAMLPTNSQYAWPQLVWCAHTARWDASKALSRPTAWLCCSSATGLHKSIAKQLACLKSVANAACIFLSGGGCHDCERNP